jgi:hypothetical protein
LVLVLIGKGDDAFNDRDFEAVDAVHHPDVVARTLQGTGNRSTGREARTATREDYVQPVETDTRSVKPDPERHLLAASPTHIRRASIHPSTCHLGRRNPHQRERECAASGDVPRLLGNEPGSVKATVERSNRWPSWPSSALD